MQPSLSPLTELAAPLSSPTTSESGHATQSPEYHMTLDDITCIKPQRVFACNLNLKTSGCGLRPQTLAGDDVASFKMAERMGVSPHAG